MLIFTGIIICYSLQMVGLHHILDPGSSDLLPSRHNKMSEVQYERTYFAASVETILTFYQRATLFVPSYSICLKYFSTVCLRHNGVSHRTPQTMDNIFTVYVKYLFL